MRRDVPAVKRPEPVQQVVRIREGQWVLHMPFLTPLSLNDRDHRMVKAKKVRTWRQAAALLVRAASIPACAKIEVLLEYVPRDSRPRDHLNLVASLKAIEDGVVDAGVIPDDNGRFHTSVMPRILAKGEEFKAGSRFRVTITALAE